MAPSQPTLGSTELEVLRFLGDHPATSVGDVADYFARTTGQARTTILTIMERLRKKGHLSRKKVGGVYRYSPRVARDDLLQRLVKAFVETTLAGSVSPFVAYLSESGPMSAEDLQQLKKVVHDLEHARPEDAP